jgi:hypothetical protein
MLKFPVVAPLLRIDFVALAFSGRRLFERREKKEPASEGGRYKRTREKDIGFDNRG